MGIFVMARRHFFSKLFVLLFVFVPLLNSLVFATEIVVVGAGLSGLTVGYRLKKAGYPVTIYEARNRPGGRVFTVRLNGAPHELGGHDLNAGGKAENISRLAQELGLGFDTQVVSARSWFYDSMKKEVISVGSDSRARIETVTSETIRKMGDLEKSHSDLGQVLNQFFSDQPLLRRVFEAKMKSMTGSETPFLSSSYATEDFLWLLKQSAEWDRLVERRQIRGGNGKLVLALAEFLKNDVKYSMPLTAIQKSPQGGLELLFEKGKKVRADILVLTLPGSVMRFLRIDDGIIPGKQLDALLSLQYGTVSQLLVPVKLSTEHSGSVLSDHVLAWFNLPNKNVMTFFYSGTDAILNDTSPTFTESLERDLGAVQAVFRGVTLSGKKAVVKPRDVQFSSYESAVGVSWPREPYTLGGYTNISLQHATKFKERTKAYGESVIEMFRPVNGAVFFAGEHTALENPATMEGAVESGERTARMLIQALSVPVTPRSKCLGQVTCLN
jgi:monoamine oxidase